MHWKKHSISTYSSNPEMNITYLLSILPNIRGNQWYIPANIPYNEIYP
jgi:hypothetical protein